jgi:hypothetical protein
MDKPKMIRGAQMINQYYQREVILARARGRFLLNSGKLTILVVNKMQVNESNTAVPRNAACNRLSDHSGTTPCHLKKARRVPGGLITYAF